MKKYIFILFFSLILISCKTYTISPDSFKEQLVNTTSESMTDSKINNPLLYSFGSTIKYKTNNIEYIRVLDKNGKEIMLKNKPSLEMKVKTKNRKSFIFYFDTVYLENDSLKGSGSRFIKFDKAIPLSEISEIYIQDGKKNFRYVE